MLIAGLEERGDFPPHEAALAATSAKDLCVEVGSKARARRWPAAAVRLAQRHASNNVVQRSAAGESLIVTPVSCAAPADHGVNRLSKVSAVNCRRAKPRSLCNTSIGRLG
jgi:hypothetical protein